MSWILIVLLIVVVLAIVILKLTQRQGVRPTEYPYRMLDVLFSPVERSFLGVFNQVIGDNAQIFGKVRVADVISPKKRKERDAFLVGACQSANVPLIQIEARSTYNIIEIKQSIAAYLPGSQSPDSTKGYV